MTYSPWSFAKRRNRLMGSAMPNAWPWEITGLVPTRTVSPGSSGSMVGSRMPVPLRSSPTTSRAMASTVVDE